MKDKTDYFQTFIHYRRKTLGELFPREASKLILYYVELNDVKSKAKRLLWCFEAYPAYSQLTRNDDWALYAASFDSLRSFAFDQQDCPLTVLRGLNEGYTTIRAHVKRNRSIIIDSETLFDTADTLARATNSVTVDDIQKLIQYLSSDICALISTVSEFNYFLSKSIPAHRSEWIDLLIPALIQKKAFLSIEHLAEMSCALTADEWLEWAPQLTRLRNYDVRNALELISVLGLLHSDKVNVFFQHIDLNAAITSSGSSKTISAVLAMLPLELRENTFQRHQRFLLAKVLEPGNDSQNPFFDIMCNLNVDQRTSLYTLIKQSEQNPFTALSRTPKEFAKALLLLTKAQRNEVWLSVADGHVALIDAIDDMSTFNLMQQVVPASAFGDRFPTNIHHIITTREDFMSVSRSLSPDAREKVLLACLDKFLVLFKTTQELGELMALESVKNHLMTVITDKFIPIYRILREEQWGIMKSNLIESDAFIQANNDQKVRIVWQHCVQNPQSRSAIALHIALSSKTLDSDEVANEIARHITSSRSIGTSAMLLLDSRPSVDRIKESLRPILK